MKALSISNRIGLASSWCSFTQDISKIFLHCEALRDKNTNQNLFTAIEQTK